MPRRSLSTRLAAAWFLLSTALLVWPVYPWLGNHVHPRVLGLPWSLVFVLLVITANFAALLLLYFLRVIDDRELPEGPQPAIDRQPSDALPQGHAAPGREGPP
jgi:hypothetical protein